VLLLLSVDAGVSGSPDAGATAPATLDTDTSAMGGDVPGYQHRGYLNSTVALTVAAAELERKLQVCLALLYQHQHFKQSEIDQNRFAHLDPVSLQIRNAPCTCCGWLQSICCSIVRLLWLLRLLHAPVASAAAAPAVP
jgi:hypothetical protein